MTLVFSDVIDDNSERDGSIVAAEANKTVQLLCVDDERWMNRILLD